MVRQHHENKNAKARSTQSDDFRRKVIKVGRKIKKNNVTKISVTSKKLNVPLQANVTSVINTADENAVLESILKQLYHYSESNRTNALKAVGQFLAESKKPESFLGGSILF
jgi:flagellar motor switch protein FliG